jgi:hypothetical protein
LELLNLLQRDLWLFRLTAIQHGDFKIEWNRQRFLAGDIAEAFFESVLKQARRRDLLRSMSTSPWKQPCRRFCRLFRAARDQGGPRVDDKIVVLSGLKPDKTIVTSGNFLID